MQTTSGRSARIAATVAAIREGTDSAAFQTFNVVMRRCGSGGGPWCRRGQDALIVTWADISFRGAAAALSPALV